MVHTSAVSGFRALETFGASSSQKKETHWLQVVSHLSPRYGGIASSVPILARATEAVSRHACPIAGFCDREELEQVPEDQRRTTRIFPPHRIPWMFDSGLKGNLRDAISSATGVHIHGLWETHCMTAADMARSCKRPYIISAHGMLELWALRSKRLKKALYAALVEIRRMQRAACLRACSAAEVDDYRRLGLSNPIAIVPNGVDAQPGVTADSFHRAFPNLKGKRIILFLGRIHQKKGLPLLLRAWARNAHRASDTHLVIAGPDSDNSLPHLKKLAEELRLSSSVSFTGMLTGVHKWSALAAASLFVLPSYSEGFSMSVLEALAMGVPVLVTTQCNIPEVELHACGWVIPPAAGPLEQVLADFLSLSSEDVARIGARGRELVRNRFSSMVVGRQLAQVYDWLQGGNKPTAVEIA